MRGPVSSIGARARERPEQLAVADGADRLSYADLDQRSGRLAVVLGEAGAGPELCVALFLERSTDFIVAALAVLKAGAAYLPLDPATPPDRVTDILADAGAGLLLTHRGKGRDLPSGSCRVLDLDATPLPNDPLAEAADPPGDCLAYVIYTSGSTGRPKGVEIAHGNLASLVAWHRTVFAVTPDDRVSQVAGLGFDAAVWEIWPALAAGASVHLADEATRRSPPALRDWLVAEGITIAFVPTVLAESLVQTAWPDGTALRTLLTGADTLRRRPVVGLPFRLVNNYGPTECTVVATSGTVAPDGCGTPSIGRPITGVAAFILDDTLQPVPAGAVGELCLAGSLVGRGYRNNPDATADRFVTFAPSDGPPVRVYRTGDRVRLLDNGEIAFLGRFDDQVKIRGFRAEPGEIVAHLTECPGVSTCAVVARDGGDGLDLVAYVVPTPDARLTVAGLREALAVRLPDYMIPAHFVALAALPITSAGKLDRAALPAPDRNNVLPFRPANEASPAPTSGCEAEVAALVASLLGLSAVEPQANFFLLGGHSMLAAQLVTQIRDRFGVALTLRQLFLAPTVTALAAAVTGQRGGNR